MVKEFTMKKLLPLFLMLALALGLCSGLAMAADSGEISIDWMPDSLGDDPDAPEYSNIYIDPAEAYAEEYAAAREELALMLEQEGLASDEIDLDAYLDAYLAEMMPLGDLSDVPEVTTPATRKPNEAGAGASSSHYFTAAADSIPVPDQGTRSICWAVAATDCLRIGAQQDGIAVPTLDPEHLVYYSYHGFTDDLALTQRDYIDPIDAAGRGNVYASLMTLASLAGPAEKLDSSKDHNIYSDNKLWLKNGYWLRFAGSEDRAGVKKAIVEYGAVAASLVTKDYFSSSYYNSTTNAFCTTGTISDNTDHEVVIIGWDDDYSASNFQTAPTDADGNMLNGAWLCRNTWGSSWGDDGYFWLSYHDAGLTQQGVGVVFDADKELGYDHIYQYDGNYTLFSRERTNAAARFANVFTASAETDHEILKAVGTYTTEAGTSYVLNIYTDLTDPTDPTSGHLIYSDEDTLSLSGYHSIALDSPVYLKAGTKFSIVFLFSTPSSSSEGKILVPICSEAKSGSLIAYNSAEAGQSFRGIADNWTDRSAKGVNYRIKAYTSADAQGHTHSWQDGKVLTAATCTDDGVATIVCSCGVVSTKALPAGHSLSHVEASKATAVAAGNTEHWKCSVCGECFSDAGGKTAIKESDTVLPALGFDDVKSTAYYHDEVLWAVKNNLVKGMTDTSFEPLGNCVRAQIVVLLWRAAGEPEPQSTTCPFTDVKPTAYYYKAVVWATEKGIVKGITDTLFGPLLECTRAQAVTLLWRAAGKPAPKQSSCPFTDVSSADYFYEAVLWASEEGIVIGMTDTTFIPNYICIRAQAVTLLYRAYEDKF